MKRSPFNWRTALAVSITLILPACTAPSRTQPTLGDIDLISHLASGGLRVRLTHPQRSVQTVPNTWTSATFTLSNSALLTADRTQTVAKTSFNDTGAGTAASTTATLFAATRQGTFTLFASTYNNSVRNAVGYTSATLTAGSSTAATVTLRTLPEWTASTSVNIAGTSGFGGDTGAPESGLLNTPKGLAVGGNSALYVCDSGNNRIRVINAARTTINTLVGDGTSAVLNQPSAATYDASHDVLFIADGGNNRIRLVTSLGTAPTLAGSSIALPASPLGLAYDASRDALYVSLANHTIVQVTTPTGTPGSPTAILGTGTSGDSTSTAVGTAVQLNTPRGLAVDSTGTYLYVADSGNHRIRRVTLADLTTTILAGTGVDASTGDGALSTTAALRTPADLAFESTDGGRLYVLDTAANVVRAITLGNGMIATVFGNGTSTYAGDGQGAQQASLYAPTGMGLTASGTLFVSESGANGHRIRRTL